ncbi:GL14730 [Drosophila persimilis]|nr:GL14730 [Drosophila persimilis]
MPSGTRLERRFHQTNSLLDVYRFLFCHPESPDEFEITTNFPKRVLYTMADMDGPESAVNETLSRTLQDVGLKNREVLFVNDLEA